MPYVNWSDKDLAIVAYLRCECNCHPKYIGKIVGRTTSSVTTMLTQMKHAGHTISKERKMRIADIYIQLKKLRNEYVVTRYIPKNIMEDYALFITITHSHIGTLPKYTIFESAKLPASYENSISKSSWRKFQRKVEGLAKKYNIPSEVNTIVANFLSRYSENV